MENVFRRHEGQHDRSLARSAWKASPTESSRRVRYDRTQLDPGGLLVESASQRTARSQPGTKYTGKNQTVAYGTVPGGGDVPGTACQATIARSLTGLLPLRRDGLPTFVSRVYGVCV